MHMKRYRLIDAAKLMAFVLLGLSSAALVADVSPNEETAKRIIESRLEELKKLPVKNLSTKLVTEYYKANVEKISQEVIKANSNKVNPAYVLEYQLVEETRFGNTDQNLHIAIHWRPNPNINQRQTLRLKSLLLPTEESK